MFQSYSLFNRVCLEIWLPNSVNVSCSNAVRFYENRRTDKTKAVLLGEIAEPVEAQRNIYSSMELFSTVALVLI